MVSLPRFFHSTIADDIVANPASPPTQPSAAGQTSNLSRQGSNLLPALGSPGSLKAVFGNSSPRESTMTDDYVDDIVPDFVQCSIMSSNTTFSRRLRLDDSAGEGLRRNVLVRNAMLSSLERERRQMAEEAWSSNPTAPTTAFEQSTSDSIMDDDEAQFFEDLLSELSGSESSITSSSLLEPQEHNRLGPPDTPNASTEPQYDDDFVQLEVNVQQDALNIQNAKPIVPPAVITSGVPAMIAGDAEARDEAAISNVAPALVDSCSSADSAPPACDDSGFAEEASRPASAASCCKGYPNVCPYPAISSFVGSSSEELPALIDDDSDAEDDDEEAEEVNDSDQVAQDFAQAVEAVAFAAEAPALLSPDGDASRSRPLSPVTSPVHSICFDYTSFRDPLSPEPSRPTSPISSASSKGDGDGPSPLLLPSDLGALPSIAELTLQLPVTSATDLMARPSRALAGAWFEHHKPEVPQHASTSADRIRWTTSPASYYRAGQASSSTSTLTDYQHQQYHLRLASDSFRSTGSTTTMNSSSSNTHPIVSSNDPTDHSVVVHWSR